MDTQLQGRGAKALIAVAVVAISALGLAPNAFAAPQTFTVNSNGDQADASVGTGGCDVGGGACTLRAAIQEANANSPDADTINFLGVSGQIDLTSTLPTITDDVTINGPGAGQLAIDGGNTVRVLVTQSSTTIRGLTIQHGQAPVVAGTLSAGGGIQSSADMTLDRVVVTDNHAAVTAAPDTNTSALGGGIQVGGGTVNLVRSTVAHNNANATASGTGQAFSNGGGIWLEVGTLHVAHSTIADNQANATVNSGSGNSVAEPSGGAIYMYQATLTISQSTLNGNSATADGGANPVISNFATGGGIYQDNLSSLTVTGSTVTDNSLGTPGGEHDFTQGSNLDLLSGGTIRDTIVAEPVGAANCSGTFTSGGYNLDEDGSCHFNQATDLNGSMTTPLNAKLAPPANNGGPTQTRALLLGSPAIDQGKSFGATTDQRDSGFPRIIDSPTIANAAGGDGADIGAFERDSIPPSKPVFGASTPKPPANNNQPKLHGTADAGSFVRIYKTAACTGKPVASGFAGQFRSPGIGVSVPDDSTTVFHATAADSLGNRSACSNGYTYREDSTPPVTSIDSVTVNRSLHRATVEFSSNEPGSTFRCRIDSSAFSPCSSPKTFTGLSAGSHTVRVVARDKAGNADPTAAQRTFTG